MATMDKVVMMTELSSVTVLRSSAAERNKGAILQVLQGLLGNATGLNALEIASGTGQHVTYFAEHLPNITWHPSECNKKSIQSIAGYIQVTHRENIKEPVWINVEEPQDGWAGGSLTPDSFDLMLCVNMVHISPWQASQGLFLGAGRYLKNDGILALYGPFKIHGEISPESNVQFDQMLKQQNSDWGLRDVDDLEAFAKENGLQLEKMVDMPANNKTVIFRKR